MRTVAASPSVCPFLTGRSRCGVHCCGVLKTRWTGPAATQLANPGCNRARQPAAILGHGNLLEVPDLQRRGTAPDAPGQEYCACPMKPPSPDRRPAIARYRLTAVQATEPWPAVVQRVGLSKSFACRRVGQRHAVIRKIGARG
jgi:hypothetical protein